MGTLTVPKLFCIYLGWRIQHYTSDWAKAQNQQCLGVPQVVVQTNSQPNVHVATVKFLTVVILLLHFSLQMNRGMLGEISITQRSHINSFLCCVMH